MSHPSPWVPWVSMQRSLSSCTLHPNSWPGLARLICHLDWNLTGVTEILTRNIGCPKDLPEHYYINKNLVCADNCTIFVFPTRLQQLRIFLAILCRVKTLFAFITQWLSVTWQVQFALGASRLWATLIILIHILDKQLFWSIGKFFVCGWKTLLTGGIETSIV